MRSLRTRRLAGAALVSLLWSPVDVAPLFAGGGPPSSNLESAFAEFQALVDGARRAPFSERRSAIRDGYSRVMQPQLATDLRTRPPQELDLLFRAADSAAFYTAGREYAEAMFEVVAELDRRGLPAQKQRKQLLRALILSRDLAAARLLRERHEELRDEVIPTIRDENPSEGSSTTAWFVGREFTDLVRRGVDLRSRPFILVVAHPDCHFSELAALFVEADPELRELFLSSSIWLAPPSGRFDTEQLVQWNEAHPALPAALAISHDDWPFVDSWDTPTFYFLKNGTVVSRIVGWPAGGREAELRAAIESGGFRSDVRERQVGDGRVGP